MDEAPKSWPSKIIEVWHIGSLKPAVVSALASLFADPLVVHALIGHKGLALGLW